MESSDIGLFLSSSINPFLLSYFASIIEPVLIATILIITTSILTCFIFFVEIKAPPDE